MDEYQATRQIQFKLEAAVWPGTAIPVFGQVVITSAPKDIAVEKLRMPAALIIPGTGSADPEFSGDSVDVIRSDFSVIVLHRVHGGPYGQEGLVGSARSTEDGSAGLRRDEMVRAFGDCGWRLQAGEMGIAPYDEEASPFGWHIVKRIR